MLHTYHITYDYVVILFKHLVCVKQDKIFNPFQIIKGSLDSTYYYSVYFIILLDAKNAIDYS